MSITHTKVVAAADDGVSEVGSQEWNDAHTVDNLTGVQDAQTPLALTRFFMNFVGSYSGYLQANLQNKSNGATASTDFVVTADTGTDSAQYADFGINSSGYAGTWGGPLDAYLYVDGGASGVGNLVIGTQQASSYVDFQVGGGGAANRVLRLSATGMLLTAFAADPATPSAGTLAFYPKTIGGRVMPKWLGPSGVDTPVQPFLGMNSCRCTTTGTGTTTALVCTSYGSGFTAGGTGTITYAQTVPATGSLKSRTRLSSLSAAAVAGNLSYVKSTTLECARETGFFLVLRFSLDTTASGNRGFFGLWASATALTNIDVVAAVTAKIGLAFNLNTGNWMLSYANGSSVTSADLGASFPLDTTSLMELVLFSAPSGSVISYRVTNMSTGAATSGDLSLNIPGNTTYLAWHMFMTNNLTAGIVKWSFKGSYLETDY